MKKEVILVPKDKCPMDVLAEMGEQTRNAWIFLHQSVIRQLKITADTCTGKIAGYQELVWRGNEKHPKTILTFEKRVGIWTRVRRIYASDIAYGLEPQDPENIIFLEMEY